MNSITRTGTSFASRALHAAVGLALLAVVPSCALEPDAEDIAQAIQPRVDAFWNSPGSRRPFGDDRGSDDMLVMAIDRANASVDVATMGFGRQEVIDAVVRAYRRGVHVRFVGDSRHRASGVLGYEVLDSLNIPSQVGNQNHLMHNKFFLIDRHMVFVGTGNMSTSEFVHSNNNFLFIADAGVVADFQAEFDQMFAGRFGAAKHRNDNGNRYPVGDATVEVWFSPQEDAMGRILEAVDNATESVEFTIFAFTKDQLGSSLIAKHREFQQYNQCCDPTREAERQGGVASLCAEVVTCEDTFRRRFVRGVVDRSQLHSNGPYHELYRLLANGVPVRLDGNDNTISPGDYQAGGGRLHAKTMLIDADRPEGFVLTGSFNWSSSATLSNDEVLLVVQNPRIAQQYATEMRRIWDIGKPFGESWIGDASGLRVGDIVFNEIHWDGYNGDVDESDAARDLVYNDQFIELLNRTDRPIDLSLWTIATNESDFVVGFYPGTMIGPRERFVIADHNTEPYFDDRPHFAGGAILYPDFVMNTANDQRFLRLNLKNGDFQLRLLDPHGAEMDIAGDGGPPFAGGRQRAGAALRNLSMERIHVVCPAGQPCESIGDGTLASSWQACQLEEGGAGVREQYRSIVIASPGEPNSGGKSVGPPDPTYRRPATEAR